MELAILLPVAVLLLAVLAAGARIALAGDRISGVAGVAARNASLARTPADAQTAAARTAADALTAADLHCTQVRVGVDTAGFAAPPGAAASLRVDVWCTVDLSTLAVRGLPGSKLLHDSASSPLDPARDLP